MKKLLLFNLILIACFFETTAQTIYSEPSPLQLSSENVTIFFNAKDTPLSGMGANAKIYAHTGYGSSWTNAPQWGTNTEKFLLTYVSDNLWQLYIGDLRSYYNIPMSTNHVGEINFVFRNAGGTVQTSDLSLPVYEEGLQIDLTSNANAIITPATAYVKLMVSVSSEADIKLEVNGQTIATATKSRKLEKEYLFTESGDYNVVATANDGESEASAILQLCYLDDPVEMDYPGGSPKMGPVKNKDGSVTFCLGAIEKENVLLVGSWNDYAYTSAQMMNYQDTDNGRYFWITINNLDNDRKYMYFFIIDGGEFTIGDPYARLVLDPYNDSWIDNNVFPDLPAYPTDAVKGQNVPVAVYQGSINDYDWQIKDFEAPDPYNLMIYELLFRDFTGTEGEALGNGTVKQAIEKLPYLKKLGINAIEVLPIMEFNGNISWGYNPNFYFAPDKSYGTPDDYKEFIDACHQNGMAVILDMVFNQSDGLHPWYQMYEPGKNPYYNRNAPHAYSVLNDWNQGNPMVQEQWADVIRYWLTEYKFDGFRFDLVKGLGLNSSYANNGDAATDKYNESRVAEMRYLQTIVNEINPKAYFINENLATAKEENEMAETGQMNWANLNYAGLQFAKGLSANSDMNRFFAPLDSRTLGSTVSYLESHDEQRLAYAQKVEGQSGVKGNEEISMRRLGAAAAQMIMTPGAHMIWQFSEMGNDQNTKNKEGGNNTDPKIVNWNLLENEYHKGLYDSYCELIDIRNSNPDLFAKDVEFTANCATANWPQGRSLIARKGDKELITLINPNITNAITMKVNFKIADNTAYKVLSKSYGISDVSIDAENGNVTLPANSYVVIGSLNVNADVETIDREATRTSMKVYGSRGEVVVEKAPGETSIYSLDGRLMGKLNPSGRVRVPAGFYMVKSGGETMKVIVR